MIGCSKLQGVAFCSLMGCLCLVAPSVRAAEDGSAGITKIPGTWNWDVDGDEVGPDQGADLWWAHETNTERYLTPQNGAALAVVEDADFDEIDARDLAGLEFAETPLSGSDEDSVLPQGTVLALRTSEGNFVKLRVAGYEDSGSDHKHYNIELEWVLYRPQPPAASAAGNRLRGGNAGDAMHDWQVVTGDAHVVLTPDGNACFALDSGGACFQEVSVADVAGKYVLLIGSVAHNRLDDTADWPTISGQVLGGENGNDLHAQVVSQQVVLASVQPHQWAATWDVLQLPAEATTLRFLIEHPHTGETQEKPAIAWFDDLGLYVFDTREAAADYAARLSE